MKPVLLKNFKATQHTVKKENPNHKSIGKDTFHKKYMSKGEIGKNPSYLIF